MAAVFSDLFPTNISRAVKTKVSGLTVTSSTAPPATVPVTFVEPDFELRDASYPGILLSYGPITRATDREHRGPTNLTYAPPDLPENVLVPADMADKDSTATMEWDDTGFDRWSSPYRLPDTPVPFNVDFNIMVVTRNYQQMLSLITALQDVDRLPERFGHLDIPEDGTRRTLELLGGPNLTATRDEDGKRLIQTLYSVRVAAEFSLYDLQTMKRVQTVDITGPWL